MNKSLFFRKVSDFRLLFRLFTLQSQVVFFHKFEVFFFLPMNLAQKNLEIARKFFFIVSPLAPRREIECLLPNPGSRWPQNCLLPIPAQSGRFPPTQTPALPSPPILLRPGVGEKGIFVPKSREPVI